MYTLGESTVEFAFKKLVFLQVRFKLGSKKEHGARVYTSELFYDYLNNRVKSASLEEGEVLVLEFEGKKFLRITPGCNGLESYVIST